MSPAQPLASIAVGVVVERRRAKSPWVDHIWRPVAALENVPETAPWTKLTGDDDIATFYLGGAEVELFSSETTNYRDNLATGTPQLWVALRPTQADPPYALFVVTADPSEGEALTEPGTDLVEPVPMPDSVADRVAAFVAQHHVERVFFKRKRDRIDPEALAPRSLIKRDERK